jgi:lantibiotic modifying enzyme
MLTKWQPLFTTEAEIKEIERRILAIDDIIDACSDSINDTGLYTGLGGFLLYKVILWKHFNKTKYYEDSEKLLNRIFDIIETKENPDLSFCSGLAGVGLLIKYLVENEVFELDHEAILNEFDQSVLYALEYCLHKNDFDLLYGATGLGIYLLERHDSVSYLSQIESIIDALERTSIVENAKRRLDQLEPYEPAFVGSNLGLAHGIPAIIIFLSKANTKGIMKEKTERLAREFVSFILSNRNECDRDISIFPNFVTDHPAHQDRYSRLAWCYGDPGVCMGLLYYSETFKDVNVLTFAKNAFIKASGRKQDSEPHPISDPFICHGSAGLAHMFNRAYCQLELGELREASLRWVKETMNFLDDPDYMAGVKRQEERLDILNGVAGTSIVLSGLIMKDAPSWDKYFLLS